MIQNDENDFDYMMNEMSRLTLVAYIDDAREHTHKFLYLLMPNVTPINIHLRIPRAINIKQSK